MGIQSYIKHENSRRFFNTIFYIIYFLLLVSVLFAPAMIGICVYVFLAQGMINIMYLTTIPTINASDDEIYHVTMNAPRWFKKKVALLAQE